MWIVDPDQCFYDLKFLKSTVAIQIILLKTGSLRLLSWDLEINLSC
jgi:hypothetical protein